MGSENKHFSIFVRFWVSQAVSIVGSALTTFAIPVWLFQVHGTAMSVAGAFSAIIVARVLAGPLAGYFVDRFGIRPILLICEMAQLLVAGVLFWAVAQSAPSLVTIYLLLALASLFETLRFPALMKAVPELVPEPDLLRANSWITFTESAADLMAPWIGAAVLLWTGMKMIVLADALSFAVAIGFLFALRLKRPAIEASQRSPTGFSESLRETMKVLRKTENVGRLLSLNVILNFIIVGLNTMLTPMVLAAGWGLGWVSTLASVAGASQIALSIYLGRTRIADFLFAIFVGALVLGLLGMVTVGIAPAPIIAVAGYAVFMASLTVINTSSRSEFQRAVPAGVQGQFFAVKRSISQITTPVAPLVFAFLADNGVSYRTLFVAGGLMTAALTSLAFQDLISRLFMVKGRNQQTPSKGGHNGKAQATSAES